MRPKRYIQPTVFQSFPNIAAAETTRHQGVSLPPFDSLNMGNYTDDNPAHITENRRLVLSDLGFSMENFCFAKQTHSDCIYLATRGGKIEGYDAIISNTKGLIIGVTVADCTPILLYDAKNQAIAAIHAGWKGTAAEIVRKTLAAMQTHFGTTAKDCYAYIGTCIAACDFEVGDEVAAQFDTPYKQYNITKQKYYIDLKKANQQQLLDFGIVPSHIQVSPHSTFSNTKDYFSHRAEKGITGRMMALIGLKALMLLLLIFSHFNTIFAQNAHQYLKKGNEAYNNDDFAQAKSLYEKANQAESTHGKSQYNLGNANYKLKDFAAAEKNYINATKELWATEDKANAFYNLGNSYYEQGKYVESLEAFKNALRLNPNMLDAKKNLALVQQHLKRKQQKPKPNNKQQQSPSSKDNTQPTAKSSPQNSNTNPTTASPIQPQQKTTESTPSQATDVTQAEQLRLLKVIQEEEKSTQQKVQQRLSNQQKQGNKAKKDW